MMGQKTIWVVYDYGGEWEDKWEFPVIAFEDEQLARKCAKDRAQRLGMDEYCDYCGSGVEQVQLVGDVPDRSPCRKPLLVRHYSVSWDARESKYRESEWESLR
mgnify:CR=1 FL=1